MSALVIKSWKAETKPIDSENNFITVTGRKGGFVAWILSLVKIDPTTTIKVGLDRVEFTSSSMSGTESRLIPLQGVCSTYYGYHKPWKTALSIFLGFFFLGASFALEAAKDPERSGGMTGLLVALIAGLVIAAIYYLLNRTLTLGFVEHSGVISGIKFKRSVIENKDINQDEAKHVCSIIQRLIEMKERRMTQQRPAASVNAT